MIFASDIKALTGQDFDQCMIDSWLANVDVLAADCLAQLDSDKKQRARLNLLAHFLILNGQDGQGQVASESLGDASWTFKSASGASGATGSQATRFGAIAKSLAPCLGSVMGDKQYGAIRLIR